MFDSLLKSIATVTSEFEKILREGTFDAKTFTYLTNVNHKLLQSLQLSVPIIDELTMVAEEYKVGLKITGAGCGGCLLVVYSDESDIKGFHTKLEEYKEKGVRLIRADKSEKGFAVDSFTFV